MEKKKHKEHIFLSCAVWALEDEDGKLAGIKYDYNLPEIEDEAQLEIYKLFLESLCKEIAKLPGAADILIILSGEDLGVAGDD